MFRRMDDFAKSWKEESAKTMALFDAIPDAAMNTAVNPEHRDLKRLAWHLVESLIEMPGHFGVQVDGKHLIQGMFIGAPPSSMQEIRETYAKASGSLEKGLRAWSDADLEKEDDMYGATWQRGFSLFVLITHQTHHRGQMTVLMRQAGLKIPDIYGPTKEGWTSYGMNAPAV
jgi:uncharacterized damage-inducible protein DinB